MEFLANLLEYLDANVSLTHLDLSGMCWGDEHLESICSLLSQDSADNLLGLHLTDNQIGLKPGLKTTLLDLFGIRTGKSIGADPYKKTINPMVKDAASLRKVVVDNCDPLKHAKCGNSGENMTDTEYLEHLRI